ncbi:sulfatase-like hydrolase/transferase, partial [Bacteroidota bacterium]
MAIVLSVTGISFAKMDSNVPANRKPNVILLFTDQHNNKVTGFNGHPDVITPNLDKLANEGFVFDRAYCTRGICVPSR